LLVQKLRLQNDMSRTALFDVFFDYEDTAPKALEFGEARADVLEMNLGYGKYDLNLFIQIGSAGFDAHLTYNGELYEYKVIEQMARHFVTFITTVLANPRLQIEEVSLLSEQERSQQISTWNSTGAKYPAEKLLCQLFEEQVLNRPNQTAVKYERMKLSFREL